MNVPAHLSAFAGRAEDYEWHRLEPVPAKPEPPTQPAAPPWKFGQPFEPDLFNQDPLKWSARYVEFLTSRPNWHEELAQHNEAVKRARREARRKAAAK